MYLKQILDRERVLRKSKQGLHFVAPSESFKRLFAASLVSDLLFGTSFEKLIFLCSCEKEARRWSFFFSNLSSFSKESFSVQELFLVSYWDLLKVGNHEADRFKSLSALGFLAEVGSKGVVVATPEGLMQKIFHKESYDSFCFSIKIQDDIEIEEIEARLIKLGYRQASFVREKGFFASRGGVFDFFSVADKNPVRLEFLGNRVISIRFFEGATQKTLEMLSSVKVTPCFSSFLEGERKKSLTQDFFSFMTSKALDEKHKFSLLEVLKTKNYCFEFERALPGFKGASFTDSLSLISEKACVVLLDSVSDVLTSFDGSIESLSLVYDALSDYPELLIKPQKHFSSSESLKVFFEQKPLVTFSKHDDPRLGDVIFSEPKGLAFSSLKLLASKKRPQAKEIFNELLLAYKRDYHIVLFFPSEREIQIFEKFLTSQFVSYNIFLGLFLELDSLLLQSSKPLFSLALGDYEGVFVDEGAQIIFCDASLLIKVESKARKKTSRDFFRREEFSGGDYVIHELHGVGRFEGLKEVDVSGGFFEFLKLIYKDEAILYVPVDRVGVLRKYEKGHNGSARVFLDKLGGNSWKTRKKKVEENIKFLASGLLKIEAERKLAKAPAFSQPNDVYFDFCSDFPFEETADQLRAIEEVQSDLEASFYMDRLLVGDVGFGKTEVAMRAAMQTVLDGYQVLFFVPTTILCKQHYLRFLQRFNKYGVRLALLSRFQKKESKDIQDKFSSGNIDILIGTHALLSLKLGSPRVGLVILDEEHKLGVKHKKLLRELAGHVNILTMTATPLPRTLNMAVIGLRDISLIQEPPVGRLSVKTYFSQKSSLIINNAISFELKRSGQIIYLHNTIENLPRLKAELEADFPELRVILVHGRLKAEELSSHMKEFIDGKSQLLLATTIVESGVDIPNVNTLIVSDSERYGLSQLHQIRGRVGRSDTQSYAYFFYEKRSSLTQAAKNRMEALLSHESLGAGFHLASTDMVLRGVGNLLGSEQSGDVLSVGIDLYLDMVEEVVAELKGEKVKSSEQVQPEIKLKQKVGLKKSYILEENERLNFYREILRVSCEETLKEVFGTLKDLYGSFPQEVSALYELSRIKLLLVKLRVKSFKERKKNNIFEVLILNSQQGFEFSGLKVAGVGYEPFDNYFSKLTIQVEEEQDSLCFVYNCLKDVFAFLKEQGLIDS